MNKYQEAFKRIKNVVVFYINYNDYKNDLEYVQELVDKETPMKPIDINGGKYCGKCKQGVIIMNFKLNSCHNLDCRQVVDWSDE